MNTKTSSVQRRGVRLAVAAAVVLAASACGNDDSKSMSSPTVGEASRDVGGAIAGDPASASAETAAAAAIEPASAPAGASPAVALPAVLAPPDNQYLAIDVSYGIEVADMTKGIADVVALSDRHGGRVYERNINLTGDTTASASFVVKLPPDTIEAAINDLDSIGTSRSASQGTEDVTSQVVDLDARLISAEASLARVRKLLESTTNIGEVISLESELTARETAVEQLRAQKQAIADRVSLATLRIQLTMAPVEPSAAVAATTSKPSIGKAFRDGWRGFVNVLAAILIFIGYTAPFLVIMLIAGAALIPFNRRRQAQRSRSAAPPHQPAAAADLQTTERDSVGAARNP